MKLTRITRTAGWLAVAGLLGAALIAPSASLAQTGNQTNVPWNAGASDCTGGPDGSFTPGAGEVVWVFVHASVDKDLTGTLTANFQTAGQQTAQSYVHGGIKYAITTGHDTLLNFSDTIDGGVLTLSHTCYAATTTTTTSDTTSSDTTSSDTTTSDTTSSDTTSSDTTTSDTTSSETTDTTSSDTTTTDTTSSETTTSDTTTSDTTTSDTTTSDTTSSETTTSDTTTSDTTSSETTTSDTTSSETTTSDTTTSNTTSKETPSGSVEAETGKPKHTPPSTDTISSSGGSGPSNGTWQLLLVAMAGLLAAGLLLTPAAATQRKKR